MADALCGPSNALQNFQKHSTVDRTLQQDRLTTRHSPSQVCARRPLYTVDSNLLLRVSDHLLALVLVYWTRSSKHFKPDRSHYHTRKHYSSTLLASRVHMRLSKRANPHRQPGLVTSSNLSIAGASPQFQQRNYAQQSQPRQLGNGWQNEFAKQQSQPVGPAASNYAGYNSIPFQRLSTIAPMAPLQAPNYPMAGVKDN